MPATVPVCRTAFTLTSGVITIKLCRPTCTTLDDIPLSQNDRVLPESFVWKRLDQLSNIEGRFDSEMIQDAVNGCPPPTRCFMDDFSHDL